MEQRELVEWRRQCKRQLRRSLRHRLDFGFVYTHKPALDDSRSRAFDTMEAYRKWCDRRLPAYLGYRSFRKGS